MTADTTELPAHNRSDPCTDQLPDLALSPTDLCLHSGYVHPHFGTALETLGAVFGLAQDSTLC